MDPLALLEQECLESRSSVTNDANTFIKKRESRESHVTEHSLEDPKPKDDKEDTILDKPALEEGKIIRVIHYKNRDSLYRSENEEKIKTLKTHRKEEYIKEHKPNHKKRSRSYSKVEKLNTATASKITNEPKYTLSAIERMILRNEEMVHRHSKAFLEDMKSLGKYSDD
ncbi:hypothetical protein BdWA1_000181 [Babesia duncani]|uniref:Uncharacterized protein n=1 Tax=Babesia duncani TaxID=323732 RepID=A0AAD9PLU9_9APIC|nr:hypothetical protein BdWA1_000181 [Babesia duncani]